MSTDPVHDPLPRYSFLPWSRRGVAARIDQPDNLGATPAAGPAGRATLTAALTVTTVAAAGAPSTGPSAVSQTVSLVGPGDVKAFLPDAVLRTAPVAGALTATPGELAFVEFYDEDFPWRYTPAKATADHKLRPWLALLVLEPAEFTLLTRPGELSILVLANGVTLPPPTESWAWAHVQTTSDLAAATDLDAYVTAAPDHALSRLMSPRRLRPLTEYRAFVVPAFETGRLAGLGTPDATKPAQQPAWGGADQPARFPVYYDWAWRTAEASDFESLARRPQPLVAGQDFGKRTLDVSDPGAGLPVTAGATVHLEGALQPFGFQRVDYPGEPGSDLADALQSLVDRNEDYRSDVPDDVTDDPVITPPAYSRLPAGVSRVADVGALAPHLDWLAELNDDPRNRAAAGLGAEIVRQRDDELMTRAWAQVAELAAVNQRLREADLAMTASERIFAKHIANADADRLLVLTASVQSAIAVNGTTTVRGEVDASRVPAAAQTTTFRRITRPQRRLVRSLAGDTLTGMQNSLITRLNNAADSVHALSTAPPAPDPGAGVSADLVSAATSAALAQQATQADKPRDVFMVLAFDEVLARVNTPGGLGAVSADPALGTLKGALNARLDTAVPAPAAQSDPATDLRKGVQAIVADIERLDPGQPGQATVSIKPATFTAHFGKTIDGKTYHGVTAGPTGSTFSHPSTTSDEDVAQAFVAALDSFGTLAASRPAAPVADPLAGPGSLAGSVAGRLQPRTALPARLATVLRGVADPTAEVVRTRRLRPVLAHPRFPDPLFEPLRLLSQDYVLPNIGDLPPETIAVMEPNDRFIESLMAGASTEMGRELLWNEYPTDQRGTYFSRFWDARDAGIADPPPDITDLVDWDGQLGQQSGRTGGLLVLVVRAELLVKFPNTVVFAQHAKYVPATGGGQGRTLDDTGPVSYPVLRGHLDPDVELYGFPLTGKQAGGTATDAGYFFCFMERPGQIRFGLDLADPDQPAPVLNTWDDLAWTHLQPGDVDQIVLGGANAGLTPSTGGLPAWNASSAHQAAILCQSPVLLARHATDMLPAEVRQ